MLKDILKRNQCPVCEYQIDETFKREISGKTYRKKCPNCKCFLYISWLYDAISDFIIYIIGLACLILFFIIGNLFPNSWYALAFVLIVFCLAHSFVTSTLTFFFKIKSIPREQ